MLEVKSRRERTSYEFMVPLSLLSESRDSHAGKHIGTAVESWRESLELKSRKGFSDIQVGKSSPTDRNQGCSTLDPMNTTLEVLAIVIMLGKIKTHSRVTYMKMLVTLLFQTGK